MGCTTGFGNLADGRPIWIGDFTGDGRRDVLFYYPGDKNWWLGRFDGTNTMQWSLAGNTAGFGNIWDGRPVWVGNFSGDGRTEVLFYYPGDKNWWLGRFDGSNNLVWNLAGNTAGFGQVWDGRPFYVGDFTGDGRTDVLFYYPGDKNWWLGTFGGGTALSWSHAGNTGGFGQVGDGRPIWTGNFSGDGRAEVLFYYPGDKNWWLGRFDGANKLQWNLAGNTGGFGQVWDGRPFYVGDFTGDGRDDVLFYFPGDKNWWLGSFGGGTGMTWSHAGNTAGFGQVADGRPIWTGNFSGDGRAEVLFYFPGDRNWWHGRFDAANKLQWNLAGNTAGFGQVWDGRPFWIGDFTGDGRNDVLFYFPGDGNWWLGTFGGGTTLSWSLAGNTGRWFEGCFDVNVILVGAENFTAAERQRVTDAIEVARGIYSQVSMRVANVTVREITVAQAGGYTTIDNDAEAEQLTADFTFPGNALDLFVVRAYTGDVAGLSPVGGPCDKNGKGMNGTVAESGAFGVATLGVIIGHEIGHYLGLPHLEGTANLMRATGSASNTSLTSGQGATMRGHCFVH